MCFLQKGELWGHVLLIICKNWWVPSAKTGIAWEDVDDAEV